MGVVKKTLQGKGENVGNVTLQRNVEVSLWDVCGKEEFSFCMSLTVRTQVFRKE